MAWYAIKLQRVRSIIFPMFLAKQATSSLGDKAYAEKDAAGGGGGLGPRWPKGLWDNSDGKHGLHYQTKRLAS